MFDKNRKLTRNEIWQENNDTFWLYTFHISIFLDASLHLYMRLCPSVGRSVARSVRPSVCRSVGNAFFKNMLDALWMFRNYRKLNEHRHEALWRPLIIPIFKIICPIPEKFRWTHLCSDWNLFIPLRHFGSSFFAWNLIFSDAAYFSF